MLARVRGWLRRRRHRGVVVLGAELAEAERAEQRHRRAEGGGPSPLAGVAYDLDETSVSRFRTSPRDDRLRQFVDNYRGHANDDRARERDALTMADFYTLLTFARRSTVAAVRARDAGLVRDGLGALAAIDRERVDPRDLTWAAALLSWASSRLALDPRSAFSEAAALADRGTAETLARFAEDPADNLTAWGYRLVESADGPSLVRDDGSDYRPTVDLLGAAERIGAVLEEDAYECAEVTVAAGLPDVWVRHDDCDAVAGALATIRAAATVSAELSADTHRRAEDQMMVAFVAETDGGGSAEVLARAASCTGSGGALGVAAGPLCCIVIGRSVVMGSHAFESPAALERFREPIRQALERARRPC